MVEPVSISQGTDEHAAYVLARKQSVEACDNAIAKAEGDIGTWKAMKHQSMLEGGQRLFEVRQVRSRKSNGQDTGMSRPLAGTWDAWLDGIGFPRRTATDWIHYAGHTEAQRTVTRQRAAMQKQESRAKQPKPFHIGWPKLLIQRLGLPYSMFRGGQAVKIKAALNPPSHFTDEAAAEAFVLAYVAAFPNAPAKLPELSDTAQQRVDRAMAVRAAQLERKFEERVAELERGYRERLYAEAKKLVPALAADYEEELAKNREETARYHLLNNRTRKFITQTEYRKLLAALHPDRAPHPGRNPDPPEDRRVEFHEATLIVLKLKDYAEA